MSVCQRSEPKGSTQPPQVSFWRPWSGRAGVLMTWCFKMKQDLRFRCLQLRKARKPLSSPAGGQVLGERYLHWC